MAKKMIIKGVGTFLAKRYHPDGKGAEVVTLGTLQDLQIDLNVEIDDIFGGDGLFPIDTLVQSKSIDITATDAKFDLDALSLMMGSSIREQVSDYLWVMNEQHALTAGMNGSESVAVAVPDFADTLYGDGNFSIRLKDSNTLLKQIDYASDKSPSEDEFMYNPDTKELIFNASHVNKDVVLNYQRTEIVDVADLLTEEVPFPVHVIHHGSFLQKDGTFQGIETELYACTAQGSFTINAQRATASSSTVSLKILDPERADGRLGTIKRYSATRRV